VRQNTRPQPTSRPQPTAGFSAAANPNPATGSQTATGTNLIKRPSQFPTAQQSHSVTQPAGSGSRTTQSVSQPTQPAASQFTLPGGQKTNSSQPKRRGFGRPKPTNFPPAGDKTAGASDPFGAIRSADSSTSVPVNSPKPPASTGFNFGG